MKYNKGIRVNGSLYGRWLGEPARKVPEAAAEVVAAGGVAVVAAVAEPEQRAEHAAAHAVQQPAYTRVAESLGPASPILVYMEDHCRVRK